MNANTNEILETIRLLSGKTDSSAYADHTTTVVPPPPPVIKETIQSSEEDMAGLSVLASINYQSLSGNHKDRDFLIRRVIRNKNDLYLDGMAMDIRAPRLIKVSHISRIHDLGSGRVYDNPFRFVQERLGVSVADEVLPEKMSEFGKAIERTGNEMTVLMYLVAIDGVRRPDERKKVFDYIKKRTEDLHYDDSELNDYLISLAPDDESFSMALQRLLTKDKSVVQEVVETMLAVILADGKVHDKERAFLARIIDLLRADGYEFNLSI